MSQSGTGRFTPKQLRVLAIIWISVVLLVGACTFLGIWWALSRSAAQDSAARPESEQAIPPVDQTTPTPLIQPQGAEGVEIPGSTPAPEPTIPPRQDTAFGYGIQAQIHINTEQTLDQVEQLGMGWVKQQIRWADLEPQPGARNWDALDAIFAATSARNLKVLVSIVDAPDWARSVTAEGLAGPPDDVQHYVDYVSELVRRYPGAVHAVEIWNEQNLEREWYTAGGLSAAAYMNLLAPTASAIHEIDPGVIVISGALTPTGVNDGVLAIDDFQYMQQMIDAGLLDYVDCVGAHHNGINLPPDISAEDAFAGGAPPGTVFIGPFDNGNPLNPHHSWSFYSTLNGYHDMIVAAGRNTPLCVTEFGWASVEGMQGEPREGFEFAYDNSLEDQAANIVQAFQLMHDWGFVRLAILFNLDFSPKAGGNPQDDTTLYSILTPEGAPRPAFDAVRSMPKPP
ncbi:MAG TPA: hypothetical protein ENI95_05795 [Chloroflexi bacterium]|nr:hypothetical protein [Chloroflexota bacterium]